MARWYKSIKIARDRAALRTADDALRTIIKPPRQTKKRD